MKRTALLLLLLALAPRLAAADGREFFVAVSGSDEADGLSRATAFRSIGRGVGELAPGDTLTVLPGEYFESIEMTTSGLPDAPIRLRADRPGTVWVRGDIDPDGFERVPGSRYTWAADVDREVEGVAERSTLSQYVFVPSVLEVDDVRCSFYQDPETGRLYVRTSDGGPPDRHALSVSVTNGFGLLLRAAPGEDTIRDVVIDGLAFSGFQARNIAPRPGFRTRWGLYLVQPERVTVRRCTAFFNGGGIGLVRPRDSVVEACTVFANDSPHHASGGNLIARGESRNVIFRNNLSHSTGGRGIRFYTGGAENCAMEGNIAFNCDKEEMQYKGGSHATSRIVGNVSLGVIVRGGVPLENIRHNLVRQRRDDLDASNIMLSTLRRFDPAEHFADPVHRDYRLQSDSALRGTGPDGQDPGPYPYRDEVFYVDPDGDDAAAGTSLRQAWRTLGRAAAAAEAGHTVYIRGGVYGETLAPARSGEPDRPVVFRRYGRERVVLDGGGEHAAGIDLAGRSHVTIEGFILRGFTGPGIRVEGGGGHEIGYTTVRSCGGDGIRIADASDVRVRHVLLYGNAGAGVLLSGAERTEVSGTVFEGNRMAAVAADADSLAGLWSDRNLFARGGHPLARIGDETFDDLAAWRAATGLDGASLAGEGRMSPDRPETALPGAAERLAGRGPLAESIGPWRRVRTAARLRIEGPVVHSVSATTVNLEWWTPTAEATTVLEWGPTPEMENRVEGIFSGSTFHTVSLAGLEPDTEYTFRVGAAAPAWEFHIDEELATREEERGREEVERPAARFRTLAEDAPARTLYVATDGDDAGSGASPETAWRTLRHAAGAVRPGDTVIVLPGVYQEFVPLRVTGDRDRPVVFRASDDGPVWLEGSRQVRPVAIRSAFKHHVHIDGFRLRDLAMSHYGRPSNAGAIEVIGGTEHLIRRCFYDGRAEGYMPYFVRGDSTRGLVIEHSVVIQGWRGAVFRRCPDLRIAHTVFYNCLQAPLSIHNEADEPVTLHHNILADSIPMKVNNPLISIWHLEALRSDRNLFFTRVPEDRRTVVEAIRVDGELVRRRFNRPDLAEETGQERNSRFGSPGWRVVDRMLPPDVASAEWQDREMHRAGQDIRPLEMSDFLADPSVLADDGRLFGPDPALFAEAE